MACVILNNPQDRVPCACKGGAYDNNGNCTACKHGKRWHGDEWKKSCGRDKPAASASASDGPVDINSVTRACLNGVLDEVKDMFPKLADKNERDAEGDTCLHKAVVGDHAEVVRYLMENGVDAQVTNASGQNAVILAMNEASMQAQAVRHVYHWVVSIFANSFVAFVYFILTHNRCSSRWALMFGQEILSVRVGVGDKACCFC
jgi:hypothetical protein